MGATPCLGKCQFTLISGAENAPYATFTTLALPDFWHAITSS